MFELSTAYAKQAFQGPGPDWLMVDPDWLMVQMVEVVKENLNHIIIV